MLAMQPSCAQGSKGRKPAKRAGRTSDDFPQRAEQLARNMPADWGAVKLQPGLKKRALMSRLTASAAKRWTLLYGQVLPSCIAEACMHALTCCAATW